MATKEHKAHRAREKKRLAGLTEDGVGDSVSIAAEAEAAARFFSAFAADELEARQIYEAKVRRFLF